MNAACQHARTETRKHPPHLGIYCADCGKWLRWVPQPLGSPGDWRMPYGKHHGQTLQQIIDSDPGYLAWAAGNLRGNVARRCAEVLQLGGGSDGVYQAR